MVILSLTFGLLTTCGCWRPSSWSTTPKRYFYRMYSTVILCVVHLLTISQFLDLVINVDNADDFTDNFYISVAMFVACCKMLSLLSNQSRIAWLMDNFREAPFAPNDDDETMIQKDFDTVARSNTVYFIILVEGTAATLISLSLITNFAQRKLLFRAWLPYDYAPVFIYSLNYMHQSVGLAFGALVQVACDSLIFGLLIHICCQLEFLGHRLKAIEHRRTFALKKCIIHHERIHRFAERLNESFRLTILVQFTVSMSIICVNMARLTKSTGLSATFLQMIFYSMCMLTQLFFYCWYGNEVKLKSRDVSDAVFEMNWAALDADARNLVLTMMQRSSFPIEFTSAHMVTMNLETFVSVLKASYSAFNVLQQA